MGETVLFIDDEESILDSLKLALKNQHFQVLTANSAVEGLKILNDFDVDVVISDHLMPETTGLEFLMQIKNQYPDIIRMLFTGNPDLPTALDAINNCGVYGFITKPVEIEKLANKITAALRTRKRLTSGTAVKKPGSIVSIERE